jgi:hypothetical protein
MSCAEGGEMCRGWAGGGWRVDRRVGRQVGGWTGGWVSCGEGGQGVGGGWTGGWVDRWVGGEVWVRARTLKTDPSRPSWQPSSRQQVSSSPASSWR